MSLINQMLRDLDKRRKREERGVPCNQTPVAVDDAESSKLLILTAGVLLLAGIVWFGFQVVPGMFQETTVASSRLIAHEVVPAVVAAKKSIAPALSPDISIESRLQPTVNALEEKSTLTIAAPFSAELLHLGIVETEDSAQLSFTFAHLPEYRLLQNNNDAVRLEVNFSQTRIAADFEIPLLTGTLLKQVSLVPQKQTLQLLVSLAEKAKVQSFQLVNDVDQKYRLLIEIRAAAPVIDKGQKRLSGFESQPMVAEKNEESAVPKINKNKNQLSREQQAYQAGLEQLEQGNLVAAVANFNQVLLLDPKREDARLQLIALLQQQMQFAKVEEILRQGLYLTPGSADLRKTYARLLLNDQRQGEAIDLLKTAPVPTVDQDLEYYALLAALLRDVRQFKEASSVYGQLVQVRPQEALWWMGMAISLEQSSGFEEARNAYQKALSLPGLRSDLQSYIQSRLQALSIN